MRRFVVAVLALPCMVGSCADAVGPEPEEVIKAEARPPLRLDTLLTPVALLSRAQRFESAAIGYAGRPSEYAAAWTVVLTAPDASHQFMSLLASAPTVAGRLYGLAGLHYTDPAAARAWLSDPPRWLNESVDTTFGCLVGPLPVLDLLPLLATGEWVRQWGKADIGPPST